ncbi:YybH family protein [Paludisphaera soli]|uniref:YybH family protein n=1 Tax=Paludisphaera soli TaxID=2712865 RepID=UPI0013EAE2AF|nr:SgcJ/EcaC family oxidoreductase [Paludisphaera soli]
MSRHPSAWILPACLGLGLVGGAALAEEAPAAAHEKADREAVQAVLAGFVKAFDAGDAPAIAALFTEDARLETEGSPPIEGRAAIERRFAERFEAEPGQTIVVKPDSLRFLGADAALEAGIAAITIPGEEGEEPEISRFRYSAAYVRKDGRWLQDCIHDYPETEAAADEPSPRERLAELEWLVGEWIDQDEDAEVHTTFDWAEEGAFLVRKYRVKAAGSFVMSGVQRIGWDPRLEQFRSWTFDSEGGFSEGLWSREIGLDRWVVKTTGVLKDGRSVSATNVLDRRGRDVLRWSSADRTLGSSALPGSENVTLVRRPPAPSSATSPSTKPGELRSQP